jgi:biotin carboxylase
LRSLGYPYWSNLPPGAAIDDDGNNEEELREAVNSARRIALKTFADGDLYIEKYLVNPAISNSDTGDAHDNIIHLGEESPSSAGTRN